ncbi:MAG: sugar phosphate nucleotidyltransferase, partial [Candidatus Margulisiibacteriota bacterium]
MKAIVLAGGLGTRLHPLTVNLPKPMVPVVNRPLMSYVIELLAQNGFNDISVLLYYQPDVIRNYFGDGKQFGVKLTYVEAQKDFGTAGAVKFACKNMREPILVISADILSDINLAAAVEYHKKKRSFATLVLTRVKNPLPYGIVITHFNGRIKKFLEKPSWSEVFSDTINAGIYILDPRVLDYIPENKSFDFSHDLFPCLLQEKKPIYGYVAKGYWEDIGKLEDYVRCNTDALKGKIDLKPAGKNFSGNNFNLEAGSTVAKSAHLEGAGLLGKGTVVGDNAFIINSAIGKNCRIGADTYIKECILWDGVEIKSGAKLERAVIGNNVKIGAGSTLEEGVVVGNEAEIGRDTHLKPYIKIWPRKVIESGSTVSRNVIWRERWSKSIFGPYRVTGVGNVEITPQFAVALGAAYGSVLGKGARITCSRDSHKAS